MSHSKSDDFLEECRSRKRNVVFPGAGLRAADLSNEAPTPYVLSHALELAREAAARITAQFGTALDHTARLKVAWVGADGNIIHAAGVRFVFYHPPQAHMLRWLRRLLASEAFNLLP